VSTPATQRPLIGLGFLLLAIGFAFVQGTVMAVELPEIVADLGLTPVSGTLAATIMIAVSGATLITAGRAADIYGRRRICLAGIVVVIGASAMSALATDGLAFFASRAIQGAGTALLLTSIGLVGVLFGQSDKRDLAFALLGASVGVGLAAAPLIAAGALALGSWRFSFWLNLPVLAIAYVGIRAFVPETRDDAATPGIDWSGTVFLAVGVIALLFMLTQGSHYGWLISTEASAALGWSPGISPIPLLGVVTLAAFVVFARVEASRRRAGRPVLMDIELFAGRRFAIGCAVSFLFVLGGYALQFMVPVFGRLVLQADTLHVTLLSAVSGVGIAVGGIAAAPLGRRFGDRPVVLGGLWLAAVALAVLLALLDIDLNGAQLALVLAVFGLGYGLTYARITEVALIGVPHARLGLASGMLVASRTLAMAIGSAALTVIMLANAGAGPPTAMEEIAASRIAFGVGLALLAAAFAVALFIPRFESGGESPTARTHGEPP